MSNRFKIFDNKPYGLRAGGIVIHDDKVLLIHRLRDDLQFYVFPGGGLEQGETIQQGIVREIKEETNQDVTVDHILYHHDLIDDSDQYFGLCKHVGGGDVKLIGEELDKQSETHWHRPCWMPMSEIGNLELYPIMIRDWLIADYPAIQRGEKPFRHWHGVFHRPGKKVA
ncbi:MAG TPA: NUDIX domain-containing protein [Alphaproteobacteria bacterium]